MTGAVITDLHDIDSLAVVDGAEDDVRIPVDQFQELMRQVQQAEYRSEQRAPSSFKTGGYGMFNRPWMWHFAKSAKFDAWLHIAFYCWTHHGKDGHCPIRGDLGQVVLGKNTTNGARTVKTAVGFGALAEGSNTRCLIAPWGVRYRTTKDVSSGCGLH